MRRVEFSDSEAATEAVAAELAATLRPGAVVLLYGDLGAGKTVFVRGMAPALGIAADQVSSPTFALIQPYRGPTVTLYHVDLYRLTGGDIADLGLDELSAEGAVLAVEWAERWSDPPPGAMAVRMTDEGGDRRRIEIERP